MDSLADQGRGRRFRVVGPNGPGNWILPVGTLLEEASRHSEADHATSPSMHFEVATLRIVDGPRAGELLEDVTIETGWSDDRWSEPLEPVHWLEPVK